MPPRASAAGSGRFVRRLCHLDERTDRDAELVQALAVSPDGRTVAAGGGKLAGGPRGAGELVLRDAATGKERFAPLRGLPTIIVGLAFSPGGDRLVSAGVRTGGRAQGRVDALGRPDRPRAGHPARARPGRPRRGLQPRRPLRGRRLRLDRDNVGGAGHVKVWEVSTGKLRPIATLTDPDHAGPVYGVAFSPDGRIAAAGVGRVRIWDVKGAGWSPGRVLAGHTGIVFAVAFRPDGKQLATAGWDRTIRLWDPDTGREVRALYGHTGFVRCLAYSPDGRRLASGSEDRSILLWDTETGRPEATFRGHQAFVMALAFHPDGRRLASGGIGPAGQDLGPGRGPAPGLPRARRLGRRPGLQPRRHAGRLGGRLRRPGLERAGLGCGHRPARSGATKGIAPPSWASGSAPTAGTSSRSVSTPRSGSGTRRPAATSPRRSTSAPPPAALDAAGAIRPDGRELADRGLRMGRSASGTWRPAGRIGPSRGTPARSSGWPTTGDGLRLASTSASGPSRPTPDPGAS